MTSVSQQSCRRAIPARMLPNAASFAPSGANSSLASRLPKSSSRMPSYRLGSSSPARSSGRSTVWKPLPCRSARCRAMRSAPLRRRAAWSRDTGGSRRVFAQEPLRVRGFAARRAAGDQYQHVFPPVFTDFVSFPREAGQQPRKPALLSHSLHKSARAQRCPARLPQVSGCDSRLQHCIHIDHIVTGKLVLRGPPAPHAVHGTKLRHPVSFPLKRTGFSNSSTCNAVGCSPADTATVCNQKRGFAPDTTTNRTNNVAIRIRFFSLSPLLSPPAISEMGFTPAAGMPRSPLRQSSACRRRPRAPVDHPPPRPRPCPRQAHARADERRIAQRFKQQPACAPRTGAPIR